MNRLKFKLESFPYFLFLGLVFLLPIFFLPTTRLDFIYAKTILLFLAVLLGLLAWVILSFRSGKLILPRHKIYLSAIIIPLVFLLSALFSPNKSLSFIGFGYEIGTFSMILLLFTLMFLISVFMRSKDRIFYFYLAFGASFLVLAIYEILRIFFGHNFLSFGYFQALINNPLGTWNDLGIISGLAVILSLISLEYLVLNRAFKVITYLVLVLSLFLLALTNFNLFFNTPFSLYTLIGLFSLIFFVYLLARNRTLSIPSLVVLIIAVIMTLTGGCISFGSTDSCLTSIFHINNLTVSPTWQSTFQVSREALSKNPVVGIGPNRFDAEWDLAKPDGVNTTDFWNADFNYAVGIIPTFISTTGILGILAFLVFLGLLAHLGFRSLFKKVSDKFSLFLMLSSFLSAIYLWILSLLSTPSLVNWSLAFIFTGLFLGSLCREGIIKEKSISYIEDSRKGFAIILFLVFVIIGEIAWGYFETNKVIAAVYYNKSTIALSAGDADRAESAIVKAANVDKKSEYYRLLSQVELSKMNTLISSGNLTADVIANQFQTLLNTALTAATGATTLDPTDYKNWSNLGDVYSSVVPLGISGAADKAKDAYNEALKRNPKNPTLYLSLARLALAAKDYQTAKDNIGKALNLKNNYIDAVYTLAELNLSQGNNQAAVAAAEAAVSLSPNDPSTYYQLGLLEYNLGDYNGAETAFNGALSLVPTYADAKYYLGLSLYKLGKTSEALDQFNDLLETNPGNKDLTNIVSNLKAGRDPFSTSSNAKP